MARYEGPTEGPSKQRGRKETQREMNADVGSCSAAQFQVAVSILGGVADATAACTTYNVSQLGGVSGAVLAFTVQQVSRRTTWHAALTTCVTPAGCAWHGAAVTGASAARYNEHTARRSQLPAQAYPRVPR